MSESGGFSFASILISTFMITGGIAGAFLGATYLHIEGDAAAYAFYGVFGIGALVGAFFAARASAGSTILEPALGAVLSIGALGALILATPIGQLVWHLAPGAAARPAAIAGGAALAGALVGAYVSEKAFGASTRSAIPWILYVAFAATGGCFLATYGAMALAARQPATVGEAVNDSQALLLFAGIGGGCLLAGLASGASARTRILFASFVGSLVGVFGFFVLFQYLSKGAPDRDVLLGAAVIGVGGGIIALLGSSLGWAAVGKRNA
jgi:hypothetical protein